MTWTQQQRNIASAGCDVAFDNLTRQLYATDASIYQIEPVGVAFPRNAGQASAVIRAAADTGLSITPRGAGTGLVGGAIGEGLIVEFARFNRQITELNLEKRTVRVGAGVVLDQLNAFLQPHGFRFGPDVATSSRATLGGMIANNSSGSHTAFYGTTADHVHALEIVLADGRVEIIGPEHDTLRAQRALTNKLIRNHATVISERMPAGLLKRWPGYGLDRWLRQPGNLADLLSGSEGTLAAIMSAELKIVSLPKQKGLGLIFFASVAEAMQATVELLDLKPAAIEHIDRVLFDQTKGQLNFKGARDLLELDARPCESILIVEFFDDVEDRLAAFARRKLGLRKTILQTAAEMNLVWSLRKAGLSLLTGCKGDAKPVTGVEDTAVRPERLPDYVAGLESIMKLLGLSACYYGHAASGLLHVRPVLDLHHASDLKKFRQVSDEVSALVRQFKGSLAAEHGVGIARTEYMPEQLGEELIGVLREIKASFDPQNRFNPGKIIPDGRFKIDTRLRLSGDYELKLPFEPMLAFAAKDGSFVRNLEQCNGCGGCRKDAPTMCPTFLVTGEEIMSTRGRANAIRAVLERRGIDGRDALRSAELEAALSNCLACKACTTECPSNVNMALLKAEFLHARHQRDGLPLRERLLSDVDALGRIGCLMPGVANASLQWRWLRRLLALTLGLSARRPFPPFAGERFDYWFERRAASNVNGPRPLAFPSPWPSPQGEGNTFAALVQRGAAILGRALKSLLPSHEPDGRASLSPASRVGRVPPTSSGSPGRTRPTGFMGRVPGSETKGTFHERPPLPSCGHPLPFRGGEGTGEGERGGQIAKALVTGSDELPNRPTRGPVILWDDTFVRYYEPHIGRAALAVLEAAGFEVLLPRSRRCCGRPAFSQGNLDEAARLGRHNLQLLNQTESAIRNRQSANVGWASSLRVRGASAPRVSGDVSIIFLEPSCYSMFAEDYRELGLPGADEAAKRCFLFEQFVEGLLSREPDALRFSHQSGHVAIHAHCHAKSLTNPSYMVRLAQRLPGRKVTLLDTGCCGMAGAFGALDSKYELSLKVAQPLVEKLRHQPPGTVLAASGTSCRHQIEHLTPFRPRHMAEVLAEALEATDT
ncbi:MAG: FAD-binding protein [Verrucomicrobia bacterium]|nr:FAD-binding protein [Verrucomicrobiota bacterium]